MLIIGAMKGRSAPAFPSPAGRGIEGEGQTSSASLAAGPCAGTEFVPIRGIGVAFPAFLFSGYEFKTEQKCQECAPLLPAFLSSWLPYKSGSSKSVQNPYKSDHFRECEFFTPVISVTYNFNALKCTDFCSRRRPANKPMTLKALIPAGRYALSLGERARVRDRLVRPSPSFDSSLPSRASVRKALPENRQKSSNPPILTDSTTLYQALTPNQNRRTPISRIRAFGLLSSFGIRHSSLAPHFLVPFPTLNS